MTTKENLSQHLKKICNTRGRRQLEPGQDPPQDPLLDDSKNFSGDLSRDFRGYSKNSVKDDAKNSASEPSWEGQATSWALQAIQGGIHFLLAAVLAGGLLFGASAPLGVALVGASGAGLAGGSALIGAGLGYLTLQGFSQGLRYLSACILTFALGFCFYDLRMLRKPWVMASITTAINGITGYFYLSHGGWQPRELLVYLGEMVVCWGMCWGMTVALRPLRMEQFSLGGEGLEEGMPLAERIALTLLGCGLLISLASLSLGEVMNLGGVVGAMVVLFFAWREGVGAGAVLGVCAGLALDLVSLGLPLYAMVWSLSALCAGFFQGKSRFHSSLAFLLANGTSALWMLEEGATLGILYESLLGTLLFVLVPGVWLEKLRLPPLISQEETAEMREIQDIARVRKQLEDTATAFRLLGETLKTAFRPPENENDVAVIFDRTANRVCAKCYQRTVCWDKDYVATFNAMNDATLAMMDRGRAEARDFPLHFSHRCLHFSLFLEEVNSQLTGLLYRKQYRNRLRESRVAVCGQYGQLSALLRNTANQISQELTPQIKKARKLREYLACLGITAQVSLQEDSAGMLSGEIVGEEVDLLESDSGQGELAELLGVPLRLQREGSVLRLWQQEPFMAVAGFASSKKEGESVSGDKSSYFKRQDGRLFVLVCDGMGSGAGARGESTLAAELLEQFLKAGVDTLQALTILSSALALRGEEGGGFTTVDLLEVNLITAQGMLYKLGAAPTYYKRGGEIRRITGKSLPAGADFGAQTMPDQIALSLEAEDCLLLVSDGISGSQEDGWLCGLLGNFDGVSPKEFSRLVIDRTPEGGKDDRTAVVVKLARRE